MCYTFYSAPGKGLEWNTVFVIGLNDGRFPSARSLKTEYEEEERRLFYVAVTRAKDELYLCYPDYIRGLAWAWVF